MSVMAEPNSRFVSDGQRPVGDHRQPRRVRRAGEEARAVDHVGLTGEQRGDEHRQLRGIELEIGVLDGDDVAARRAQAKADGVALAAIPLGVDDVQRGRSRGGRPALRACRRSSRR